MLEIEIVECNIIEGGIEVFARAWKNGEQIGFGTDGTVDIEHFCVLNPPILVANTLGDVVINTTDKDGNGLVFRYIEDPGQALVDSIFDTIAVKQQIFGPQNIIPNKVGNTTTTVYPTGDANITSGGPTLNRNLNPMYIQRNSGDAYRGGYAITLPADPGSQQIDTLTFSVEHNSESGTHTTVEAVEISRTDWDVATFTWNVYKTGSNWSTGGGDFGSVIDTRTPTTGTNSWVLKGTGADNPIDPAWGSALRLLLKYTNDVSSPASNWWGIYSIEQTGTTNDPRLVIEHSTITASSFVPCVSFIM